MTQYPEYTPISSLGRELGIMFAFLGACVVTMGVYSVIWRRIQLRTQTEDLARRKALKNRAGNVDTLAAPNGFHFDRNGSRNGNGNVNVEMNLHAAARADRVFEKMEDRVHGEPVELPVHGWGRGVELEMGARRGDLL